MPITAEHALSYISDDPQDFNLPPDASEDQVNKAREQAAASLMAGVAANDAYWNSRGELEQLLARAAGHGVPAKSGETAVPTAVGTRTEPDAIEGTAVEEPQTTGAAQVPAGTAPAEQPPAPMPANPAQSIASLRAQVERLGETPEA